MTSACFKFRCFCMLIFAVIPGVNLTAATNPWELDLMIRTSADGADFGPEALFCKAAGVPSLVRDQRWRLLAAFQMAFIMPLKPARASGLPGRS